MYNLDRIEFEIVRDLKSISKNKNKMAIVWNFVIESEKSSTVRVFFSDILEIFQSIQTLETWKFFNVNVKSDVMEDWFDEDLTRSKIMANSEITTNFW